MGSEMCIRDSPERPHARLWQCRWIRQSEPEVGLGIMGSLEQQGHDDHLGGHGIPGRSPYRGYAPTRRCTGSDSPDRDGAQQVRECFFLSEAAPKLASGPDGGERAAATRTVTCEAPRASSAQSNASETVAAGGDALTRSGSAPRTGARGPPRARARAATWRARRPGTRSQPPPAAPRREAERTATAASGCRPTAARAYFSFSAVLGSRAALNVRRSLTSPRSTSITASS